MFQKIRNKLLLHIIVLISFITYSVINGNSIRSRRHIGHFYRHLQPIIELPFDFEPLNQTQTVPIEESESSTIQPKISENTTDTDTTTGNPESLETHGSTSPTLISSSNPDSAEKVTNSGSIITTEIPSTFDENATDPNSANGGFMTPSALETETPAEADTTSPSVPKSSLNTELPDEESSTVIPASDSFSPAPESGYKIPSSETTTASEEIMQTPNPPAEITETPNVEENSTVPPNPDSRMPKSLSSKAGIPGALEGSLTNQTEALPTVPDADLVEMTTAQPSLDETTPSSSTPQVPEISAPTQMSPENETDKSSSKNEPEEETTQLMQTFPSEMNYEKLSPPEASTPIPSERTNEVTFPSEENSVKTKSDNPDSSAQDALNRSDTTENPSPSSTNPTEGSMALETPQLTELSPENIQEMNEIGTNTTKTTPAPFNPNENVAPSKPTKSESEPTSKSNPESIADSGPDLEEDLDEIAKLLEKLNAQKKTLDDQISESHKILESITDVLTNDKNRKIEDVISRVREEEVKPLADALNENTKDYDRVLDPVVISNSSQMQRDMAKQWIIARIGIPMQFQLIDSYLGLKMISPNVNFQQRLGMIGLFNETHVDCIRNQQYQLRNPLEMIITRMICLTKSSDPGKIPNSWQPNNYLSRDTMDKIRSCGQSGSFYGTNPFGRNTIILRRIQDNFQEGVGTFQNIQRKFTQQINQANQEVIRMKQQCIRLQQLQMESEQLPELPNAYLPMPNSRFYPPMIQASMSAFPSGQWFNGPWKPSSPYFVNQRR